MISVFDVFKPFCRMEGSMIGFVRSGLPLVERGYYE